MTPEEAREWLAGTRSMANIVPREPFETWQERIARADAAMMEQAYWVHRAHDQDQKPPPPPPPRTRTGYFTCHHEPWQLEVYAHNPRPAAEGEESMTKDTDHMPELPSPVLDRYWRGGVEIVCISTESSLCEIVGQAQEEEPDNELPGALDLALHVREGKWPHTMGAQVWAKKWLETLAEHPDIATDEGAMIGWFANAIMAGHDQVHTIQATRGGSVNIKEELLDHIGQRDAVYVSIRFENLLTDREIEVEVEGTLDTVLPQVEDLDYDAGHVSQRLFGHIWYADGTWSDRAEYDGSEWWVHRVRPPCKLDPDTTQKE